MELYIRSQNRENTVKINRQYGLHWKDKTMIIADYQPDFVGTEGEYYELLGKYKSKERALEVLDEIQHKIINSNYYDIDGDGYIKNVSHDDIVYEMPKE